MKIKNKLLLFFLLLGMLPLLLLGTVSYLSANRALKMQADAQFNNTLELISVMIDSQTAKIYQTAQSISVDAELSTLLGRRDETTGIEQAEGETDILIRLMNVRRQVPEIRSIFIVPERGETIYSGIPTGFEHSYFRKTFRDRPLFARIRNETTLPVWMTGVENYFDRIYLFLRLQNMITGENLGVLVISLDETFISSMFGKALTGGDAEIFLTNGSGQVISSWPETVRGIVYSTSSVRRSPWLEHSLSLHQNWTLIMRQSLFSILSGTRALGLVIGLSSLMLVLLSLLGSFYLTNHFSQPIFSLLSAMKQVEAGQFVQIPDSRKDEFAQLYAGYNAMADQLGVLFRDLNASLEEISRHKREMEEYNESLEKTVRERTDILLQSEKMAALGSLVAGVAHEINTPLGLGITSVSYQDENLDDILGQFESNTLTKGNLERFLSSCRQANSIALTNLRRAAELVASFKRIAIDQTSGDLREFSLRDCLHDTLVSLGPRLSKCRQTVDVQCPEDIRIRNSPGAFYQIVSNLVLNAVIHAWDSPDEEGTVTVSAALESDTLVLTVTDDGQGMDEQTCGRIFDPFFTTKRETGGSGLGLYVVYNLVDQQLKGRITCTSKPGNGTCFRIRCPART